LAGQLGLVGSTVRRVPRRHRVPALAVIDPITATVVRRHRGGIRYEQVAAGELLHIAVKLGRLPNGGGRRLHGHGEAVRGHGGPSRRGRQVEGREGEQHDQPR
jgi:hypothetical protein